MASSVRLHIEVLGWLHVIWGGFGLLAGASLVLLAGGTQAALVGQPDAGPAEAAAVWILLGCGGVLGLIGGAMIWGGRALLRAQRGARAAVLGLAIPNLLLVPFGTALAGYTCWVLLNDDARRQFGRAPESSAAMAPLERR
jgi:hypothetical protein